LGLTLLLQFSTTSTKNRSRSASRARQNAAGKKKARDCVRDDNHFKNQFKGNVNDARLKSKSRRPLQSQKQSQRQPFRKAGWALQIQHRRMMRVS
jgi:hypothetical protein